MANLVRDRSGRIRLQTWADGVLPPRREPSLMEEARKHPKAVINRLIKEERWTEAEVVMDRYL